MPNEQTTVPLFTAGEVLTAADMNLSAGTGVPVFASTTTRDAGFGGAGEKVLAEGQLCYLSDSNVVQYYNGSAWATVGPTSTKIGQVLSTTLTTTFSRSSTTFGDITGLTVSITPSSASSKIYIVATVSAGTDPAAAQFYAQFARGGSVVSGSVGTGAISNRIAVTTQTTSVGNSIMTPLSMTFLDSPSSTSSLTYSVQIKSAAGTIYVNQSQSDVDSAFYARGVSTITVFEVLA